MPQKQPRVRQTVVSADGTSRLCGLPAPVEGKLQAQSTDRGRRAAGPRPRIAAWRSVRPPRREGWLSWGPKVRGVYRVEVARRAARAAFVRGCQTGAVFPYEGRNSQHRLKANEAYQIGESGHPVRAYLSVPEIIRAAQRTEAEELTRVKRELARVTQERDCLTRAAACFARESP